MEAWLEQRRKQHSSVKASAGKGEMRGTRPNSAKDKKRRVEPVSSSSPIKDAAILAIGDLALETAKGERLLTGSLMRTFLCQPSEVFNTPLDTCNNSAGSEFQAQEAWAALVTALSTLPPRDGLQEQLATVKQHATLPAETWASFVNHCRVCETFDKQYIKVQIWCADDLLEIVRAISKILIIATSAIMKWGAPPRSSKERKVAQILGSLRKI
jgi:hypothetical protein